MKSKQYQKWNITGNIVMIFLSVLAIAPFLLLIISSFTDETAAIRNGYSFLPEKLSLAAFRYIFTQWGVIGRGYGVSIFVTFVGTVTGIIIAAMLGYALSKRDLPGRRILLFLVTFVMFFNGGLTATYIIYTKIFHIKDTILGLLLPGLLLNGYYIMMFRNYFENSIPQELIEASKIDGASETKSFFSIIVPISLPIFVSVGVPLGLAYWNDWMNGMYYLSASSKLQSIQTILNNMNENIKFLQSADLGVSSKLAAETLPSATIRMAIAVVGILPIICVFPFMQKWLVKGITAGAVKG